MTATMSNDPAEVSFAPERRFGAVPKNSEARPSVRRDREFRRYAEVVIDLRPAIKGQTAVSSRDFALTAYAQLVALRLDVKRVLISLFDADHQYIIAEATQTLSLQHDDVHSLTDAMWFGAGILDRQQDFNRSTLRATKRPVHDGAPFRRYFEVRDLLQNPEYANHRFVLNEPHARSYAGVPLISPTGYPVGTLSVLDDKIMSMGVSDDQVAFLEDMGKTVMSHLETHRLAITHARALEMIKGLSRFVEGKGELKDDLDASFDDNGILKDRSTNQTTLKGASRRSHALNAASTAERRIDVRRMQSIFTNHGTAIMNDVGDAAPPVILARSSAMSPSDSPPIQPEFITTDVATESRSSLLADGTVPLAESESKSSHREAGQDRASNTRPKSNNIDDLQEKLLSKDVRESFERAAVIINNAMNVSGTLFLDASVGEFGKLRNDSNSCSSQDSDGSNESGGVGEVDIAADTQSRDPVEPTPRVCRYLASAYDIASSADGRTGILHKGVPERFLKSLIRRFPHGKIWTFDPNGYTSSDEQSDSSVTTNQTADEQKKEGRHVLQHKRKRRSDGSRLADLFPGVRSLCLLPMYDQLRERYFAGALVWACNPIRVLSVQEDQNYLGAFCDVVMAEVGRLDAQAEARTKTSFISSISHELRSPLHGMLGGIECLQDKDNVANQDEVLEMIDASGRSLLDIINHLLDHAHADPHDRRQPKNINQKLSNREPPIGRSHSTRHIKSSHQQPLQDLALLTEEIIDTALWTTPKPTPLPDLGQRPAVSRSLSTAPIKIVLDIDSATIGDQGWWFCVNSGAWRRVVQNIVANSIKYTDTGGYLKVSLSVEPAQHGTPEQTSRIIELTCLDSGRGISHQYLHQHLWKAFTQEDSNSQGMGLGLSLVHAIVKEMGGSIDIQSSKDVGTAFRIKVPLHRGGRSSPRPNSGLSPAVMEWLKVSTYAMVDFDEDDEGEERVVEANNILKSSITAACNSHGMQLARDEKKADIFVILEHKARDLINYGARNDVERAILERPLVILCHSGVSSRALSNAGEIALKKAVLMRQPLGPRKLAKALTALFERFCESDSTDSAMHQTGGSLSPLVLNSSGTSDLSDASQQHLGADIERTPDIGVSATTQPKPRRAAPRSGLSVLLVDDNDLNLFLLRTYMTKNGHDFICASNGQEAVDRYKASHEQRSPPNEGATAPQNDYETLAAPLTITLMDITMPVMSGLEATRQIRAYERNLGIHRSTIIALTALGSAEVRQEAFGSGVDLFLTKPLKLKDLTNILADHLESGQSRAVSTRGKGNVEA